MKDAPVLHAVEYAVFRVVLGLLRLLPHRASRALGGALGRLAFTLDRRHRDAALANLAAAFPDKPEAERCAIAAGCFRRLGAAWCDTLSATRFGPVAFCERLRLEGWEHVEAAEALGRGVFFLSAHLGQWEIAAYPPGLYGGPLHVVGRPLDNPRLDRHLRHVRERFGNVPIAKRGAARGMLKAITRGGRVGILLDQRVKPAEGIDVPFFGRPALTSPLLARLVLRTGAPVVPIFGYPEPGGRYRFVAREPLWAPEDRSAKESDTDAAIHALTTLYSKVTEDEIRRDPYAWMWMHDRWKHPGDSPRKEVP